MQYVVHAHKEGWGIEVETGQEPGLRRGMFSVIFIRYGKTGTGITKWKTVDFFCGLFPSVSNTDFVLCCKMTYPGKFLISHLYFPARTWTVASLISCNNSSLCLWQTFLRVYCQRSWGPVSNPRKRANLAPLQFLLQMLEKEARCVIFFPEV